MILSSAKCETLIWVNKRVFIAAPDRKLAIL